MMPTEQQCPVCGEVFQGSDALGDPCPNCSDPIRETALQAIDKAAQADDLTHKLRDAGDCRMSRSVGDLIPRLQHILRFYKPDSETAKTLRETIRELEKK